MLLFAVVNMRQLESATVRLPLAEWRPPYAVSSPSAVCKLACTADTADTRAHVHS